MKCFRLLINFKILEFKHLFWVSNENESENEEKSEHRNCALALFLALILYPKSGSNRYDIAITGVWDQRVYQFRHPGIWNWTTNLSFFCDSAKIHSGFEHFLFSVTHMRYCLFKWPLTLFLLNISIVFRYFIWIQPVKARWKQTKGFYHYFYFCYLLNILWNLLHLLP